MNTTPKATLQKGRFKSVFTAVGMTAVAILTLAGCASTASDSKAAVADSGINIAVVGGMTSDTFFSVVKNGVDAAGKAVEAAGGKVTYLPLKNYDNLGPDAADLVRNAIALKVSAIAVPNWVAEAEDGAIKDAVAAGIKVWIYNAGGLASADKTGGKMYIGSDEYKAGVAGGEYFGQNGAKNILCINTAPGAVNIEQRCDGVADGAGKNGAKSKQLPLPSSSFGDASAVAQAIKGALVKDPTIDGVITIGAADADAAASGIEQAGLTDKVKLGTFDMSESVLTRIKDGTQLFAIDQQGFLQGYMAVSMAWLGSQYAIQPATREFLTGPSLVTSENVEQVLAGVTAGAR